MIYWIRSDQIHLRDLLSRKAGVLVSIGLFVVLAFGDVYIFVHEVGHWLVCALQGGEPVFKEFLQGPGVQCHGGESVWQKWNYALFYGGGVLAEIGLGLTLLISNFTRLLGSLTLFKVAGSFAFTRLYSHDLSAIAELFETLSVAGSSGVNIAFIILSIGVSGTVVYFIKEDEENLIGISGDI